MGRGRPQGHPGRRELDRKTQPSSDPSDTPGVAIVSLAQTHAANHRLSLDVELTMYEAWLRQGRVAPADIFRVWAWEELPISLEGVRSWYKRYFELLIRTLLLGNRPRSSGSA